MKMKIDFKRCCRFCAKEFTPNTPDHFYCSRECNQKHWYRNIMSHAEHHYVLRRQTMLAERIAANLVYPATFLAFANLIDKTLGKK